MASANRSTWVGDRRDLWVCSATGNWSDAAWGERATRRPDEEMHSDESRSP